MSDSVRKLYLEITEFLSTSGGSYTSIDTSTYRDIIDAILDERYRVVRDDSGRITSVTTWWMIHETDIELVKNGGRPKDLSSGAVVYISDHAGCGGYPGLIRFIRSNICKRGACWHHRYKHPALFRYYPQKRGAHA
jgi:hypothetical protein